MNSQTLNAMIGQVKLFSRCSVFCETDADLFLFGIRADWITSLNCNQRHIVARWEFVSNNIPKMLFYSVHPLVWKEFYSVFFSLNHTASISNFNFLLCLNSTTDTCSRSALLCILLEFSHNTMADSKENWWMIACYNFFLESGVKCPSILFSWRSMPIDQQFKTLPFWLINYSILVRELLAWDLSGIIVEATGCFVKKLWWCCASFDLMAV